MEEPGRRLPRAQEERLGVSSLLSVAVCQPQEGRILLGCAGSALGEDWESCCVSARHEC